MQPNYAFRYDRDKSILYRTADTAKLLGMCVELEINDVENPLDVSRYKEYLAVGAETGYMDAVKSIITAAVPASFTKRIGRPTNTAIRSTMTPIGSPRGFTAPIRRAAWTRYAAVRI